MATLLDLANSKRMVKVGDIDVSVTGISTESFINLLQQYPPLLKAFAGSNVSNEELMKVAPDAVAAIIASGCGYSNDPQALEIARNLPMQSQMDLLQEVLNQTFPRGVGPFVDQLVKLGFLVQDVQSLAPDPNRLSPSSQEPVTSSSDLATPIPSSTLQDKSLGG
jgi:hypothetical protein